MHKNSFVFCLMFSHSLGMDDNAVDITGSQASHVSEGGDDFKVRCPCGCNEVRLTLIC